jgi:type II secretory pathway component GspD/PulD (secretin)
MAMNLLVRIFLLAALLLSPDASFAYEMKSVKGDDTIKDTGNIVQIPEIRKKLKTPITVDFMDVGLDYVIDFLSDATGVNIIPGSGVKLSEKKVAIKVKDMPLESLLKYIFRNQGLTYRIEKNAIWVDTMDNMDNETPETRMYFLDQGLAMFTEFSQTASSTKTNTSETAGSIGGNASISKIKTIKDTLENAVAWPSDSKINLDERTGALIVTNTPSNLKIIEDILYNLDVDATQILVEARFVEVNVTDLSELGVNLSLDSPWAINKQETSGTENGAVTQLGTPTSSQFSTFANASEGLNLTYQGILTKPQFSAVLHALDKKTNLKTLSAPKITTLNNQTATIEIADEFVYPTRYEPTLIKEDLNGNGTFTDVVNGVRETRFVNVPQSFETRPIGILLNVTPSVGKDKETIALTLNPEVSEAIANAFEYSGEVKLPKFTTRNLSTNIVVHNGDTIMLGGLIKESKTNTRTKVPFLGDLPIMGALFRKDSDSTVRKNLLIFVTASILSPEGEQLK